MKKRIVFVLPSFAGGGAERVIISLANSLNRHRFIPLIIALNAEGPLHNLVLEDIEIINIGRKRLRLALKPLVAAIRQFKPHAIVSTMGYLNLGILLNRKKIGNDAKIIVREANEVDATINAIKIPFLGKFLYRYQYPHADWVITPNDSIARDFRKRWRVPAKKGLVLPNPVDVKWLRERAGKGVRKPGIGLRFVASGRLVYQKGFDRLIKWLVEMPIDTHLTIFGTGPCDDVLRQRAEELLGVGRINFAGFVENPWPTYAGADAFLLTSRWEGMSNASLEALALGTPVIGTPQSGGLRELASQTVDSAVTLADPGKAFINTMARTKPKVMGVLCASLLPELYTLDSVTAKFEELLTG